MILITINIHLNVLPNIYYQQVLVFNGFIFDNKFIDFLYPFSNKPSKKPDSIPLLFLLD